MTSGCLGTARTVLTVVLIVGGCPSAGRGAQAGDGWSTCAGVDRCPAVAPTRLLDPSVREGAPVTLAALLREAVDKNPDLEALRREVDVLRQKPAAERALMPPAVEAQVWQWPLNTVNPANANMYMFMVSQDLPGRRKRDLRAAVAEKDVALAASDVAVRTAQVVDDLKQAYASLFVARKAIDIHLAGVDLLRQIADAAQAKYAAGRISQQDVLKPVVELSKLHADLVMLDEQARLATARINALIDRPPETPIGPLAEPQEQVPLPPAARLQQLAIDRRPELQSARLAVERAEAELAAAVREYEPDFSVQGGYMLAPGMTDAWMGRIAVTWPRAPWSRGRIDAKVAEQRAAVEAAKSRVRAMENMVRLSVQEAYVRAKAAQDRAALLRTTILPQSEQALAVSRVAYEADRVDLLALIENERTLLDSQLDYFRALGDF